MAHDLVAWYESAAKTGLTLMTRAAGEDIYAGAGDDINMHFAGRVSGVALISAAIANLVQGQIQVGGDENGQVVSLAGGDQTGVKKTMDCSYRFAQDAILRALADNGGNAQVECLLAALSKTNERPWSKNAPLVDGAHWIRATGTATLVAGTWTLVVPVYDYTFDQKRKYKIIGMMAQSATGYAARVQHRSGPNMGERPGVPASDTVALAEPLYGDFGTFEGASPPNFQFLASAGDTAEIVELLVV